MSSETLGNVGKPCINIHLLELFHILLCYNLELTWTYLVITKKDVTELLFTLFILKMSSFGKYTEKLHLSKSTGNVSKYYSVKLKYPTMETVKMCYLRCNRVIKSKCCFTVKVVSCLKIIFTS